MDVVILREGVVVAPGRVVDPIALFKLFLAVNNDSELTISLGGWTYDLVSLLVIGGEMMVGEAKDCPPAAPLLD